MIGEEEGGGDGEHLWIIDPIDGTANYARGIAALLRVDRVPRARRAHAGRDLRSEPRLALRRRRAARARGATASACAVSPVADMSAATVECGWSTRRPASAYVDLIARVLEAGGAIRRAGSGALGLADVAAGAREAYAELHINSWDCAAGIVLVKEAGGFTNDFFAGDGLRVRQSVDSDQCGALR